ncbi:MAG: PEP-CTERM sorting domain-containing protein [Planctomycetota bacterium]|jgi:hypothetical protein
MERGGTSLLLVASLMVCLVIGDASADEISFDFSGGIDPNFEIIKNRDFWNVTTDSTGLRISKLADDGSTFAEDDPSDPPTSEFLNGHDAVGGVNSVFTLVGDFSVAVDFSWDFIKTPTFSAGDTAAGIWLSSGDDLAFRIQLKNFRLYDGRQYTNMNYTGSLTQGIGPGVPLEDRLIITRVGHIVTGYATDRRGNMAVVGEFGLSILGGPLHVGLVGLQNQNVDSGAFDQIDPRGPMDVSFNNLTIEADQIVGIVPEPGTLALFGLGIAVLAWWRRSESTTA